MIIECKNLPDHGWIFFRTKREELIFPDKVTIADGMPSEITEHDPTRYYSPITPIPNLFNGSGYDEYIFDSGKRGCKNKGKSNERTENIYGAVNKVTKATRYQIETTRSGHRGTINIAMTIAYDKMRGAIDQLIDRTTISFHALMSSIRADKADFHIQSESDYALGLAHGMILTGFISNFKTHNN